MTREGTGSLHLLSLWLFAPGCGYLGVNLTHRQLVGAPALRGGLDVLQPMRGSGNAIHLQERSVSFYRPLDKLLTPYAQTA